MQGSNSSSLPQTYLWCYRLARGARRRCLAHADARGRALILNLHDVVAVALQAVAHLLRGIARDEEKIHDLARREFAQLVARLDVMQWAAVSREVDHGRLRLFALDRRQRGGEVQLLVDGLAGRRRVQHPYVHAFAERLQGRIVELRALTIEFGEQLAHATTEIAGGQRLAEFLCNERQLGRGLFAGQEQHGLADQAQHLFGALDGFFALTLHAEGVTVIALVRGLREVGRRQALRRARALAAAQQQQKTKTTKQHAGAGVHVVAVLGFTQADGGERRSDAREAFFAHIDEREL